MLALSKGQCTGCNEGNTQVVACLLEGNAETVYDQLVSVVEEGEVQAFINTT